MNNIIEVKKIWKKYKYKTDKKYLALRDVISEFFTNPLNYMNKSNSEFWALKDINFSIDQGDVLGIIGKNGAGKSTLLKILSKITPPSKGEIRLKGRVGSMLEVGTGFHPELTGRENIYLNGALLGMRRSEIKKKFDQIVEFAEVEKFLDTPVKHFSSGMYTRLAFSVAAHLEPEILIVDEVLSVGDIGFQKKSLDKMKEVSSKGLTILLVSHNMANISMLCNKTMLIDKGKQIAFGKTEKVIKQYLSLTSNKSVFNKKINRPGTKESIIENIEHLDLSGKKIDLIPLNYPLQFTVDLINKPSAINKKITISLHIADSNNVRLLSLVNDIVGSTLKIKSKKQTVICKVNRGLPLIPGRYSLSVSILLNGILADKVIDAYNFEISARDIYQTGQLPSVSFGPILVENHWE